jgi:hypothetical protein
VRLDASRTQNRSPITKLRGAARSTAFILGPSPAILETGRRMVWARTVGQAPNGQGRWNPPRRALRDRGSPSPAHRGFPDQSRGRLARNGSCIESCEIRSSMPRSVAAASVLCPRSLRNRPLQLICRGPEYRDAAEARTRSAAGLTRPTERDSSPTRWSPRRAALPSAKGVAGAS